MWKLGQAVVMGDSADVVERKGELRTSIRRSRKDRLALEANALQHDAQRIAEHVMDLEEVRHACTEGLAVSCYVSRPDEPPTQDLRAQLRDAGATLLLPRIEGDSLVWVQITSDTTWVKNRWNIDEPAGVAFDGTPAVWIIPGLAIDADGYRLGQGGGYYDRTLGNVHDDVPIIAILFEDEVLDEVPREEHDHRVDIVVTPDRVRWLSMPD
jgi:5-formyltetrahydrofolate cyclo-ligase